MKFEPQSLILTLIVTFQVVDVPADAKVSNKSSHCGNTTQVLSLYWSVVAPNDTTVYLKRNLTIEFSVKPNET